MTVYNIVMMFLLMFSTLGIVNFISLKRRITFFAAFPLVVCGQTLLMFFASLVHCLAVCAWSVFSIGLCLFLLPLIRGFWLKRWHNHKPYMFSFRREHLFVMISVLCLHAYLCFSIADPASPDLIWCWYNHFVFLLQHGAWADSRYTNFAHAYCMIANAYASYLSTIVSDIGTRFYSFAMLAFSFYMMLPAFAFLRWRKLPPEMFAAVALVAWGRICNQWLIWDSLVVLGLCSIRCFIGGGGGFKALNHGLFFYLLTISLLFCITSGYWCVIDYPFDSTLAATTFGILATLALSVTGRMRRRDGWVFIPMLAVLVHVKPTGFFPALVLSLFIAFRELAFSFSKSCRTWGMRRRFWVMAFLIIATPIIAYCGWQRYCVSQGWTWHMSFDMKKQMMEHWQNGVPQKDWEKWKEKVASGGCELFPTGETWGEKSLPMRVFERCWGRIACALGWNFDRGFSVHGLIRPRAVHSMICVFLLLAAVILPFVFQRKGRWKMFYLVSCGGVLCGIVFVNQVFIAPMYTALPLTYRYLHCGVVAIWCVCLSCIGMLMCQARKIPVLLSMFFVFWSFSPILLSHISRDGERYPWWCFGLMAANSKAENYELFNSHLEHNKYMNFLLERGLVPPSNGRNYMWPKKCSKNSIMFYNGTILAGYGWNNRKWKIKGNFDKIGFYYAPKNPRGEFVFSPLYCNEEAFDLVRRAYQGRDWHDYASRKAIKLDLCAYGSSFRDNWQMVTADGRVVMNSKDRFFFFDDDIIHIKVDVACSCESMHMPVCKFIVYDNGRECCGQDVELQLIKSTARMHSFVGEVKCRSLKRPITADHFGIRLVGDVRCAIDAVEARQNVSGALNLQQMISNLKVR